MSPLPQFHLLHDNPTSSPGIGPPLNAHFSFPRNHRLHNQGTSYGTDPETSIRDKKALHGPSALHIFNETNEDLSCSLSHHIPQVWNDELHGP